MNRLFQATALVIVGLAIVTAATPALTKLTHALIPLIITVGVVVALLRAVWFYTR
jgi:hypothetical protein